MSTTKVPIGVLIAKKTKEKLEDIGVTEELVLGVLKDALSASKIVKDKMGNVIESEDWTTRLSAVRLYMEITMVEPKSAKKAMGSAMTTMESIPGIESGDEETGDNVLQLPENRVRTLEEQREWQRRQAEMRNTR